MMNNVLHTIMKIFCIGWICQINCQSTLSYIDYNMEFLTMAVKKLGTCAFSSDNSKTSDHMWKLVILKVVEQTISYKFCLKYLIAD